MKDLKDTFTLSNGSGIPCMGYGTYQTMDGEIEEAIVKAVEAGYRHIDTAAFYHNEEGVGRGVAQCAVPRGELFVTSKVWNTDRGYEQAKASFEKSLERLGLQYLDLLLIHWPANRRQFGEQAAKINADTWKAFEELYEEGRVKAIGVSNFYPHHLEELAVTANICPMVNQIEFHPGWAQADVVQYCQKKGIVVEAWSPLGRRSVLENKVLQDIAAGHNKSTAQISLRWALQHGVVALPKSVSRERMEENADIFNFELSEEEMGQIDKLERIGGQCVNPDEIDF